MKHRIRFSPLAILSLLLFLSSSGRAAVVINEIFYHAPDEMEGLEYVEIHNPESQAVDLTGWRFTKGIRFKFPAQTILPPKGYLVICRNLERFHQFYPVPALGGFKQSLSNTGEEITLEDKAGHRVDSVHYSSRSPWPMMPGGYGASLERISPNAESDSPQNWTASPVPSGTQTPGGTPGTQNSGYSENLPPVVANLQTRPAHPAAGIPLRVEVEISDPDGVGQAHLLYRVAGSGSEGSETRIPLTHGQGQSYSAEIPGQPAGKIIRFRVEAIDTGGHRRFYPAESDLRPAFSAYVRDAFTPGKIPVVQVIHIGTNEFSAAAKALAGNGGRGNPEEQEKRFRLRQQLESAIPLPELWFELLTHQDLSWEAYRKLRPVILTKRAELNRLMDDVAEAPNLDERAKAVPDIAKTFHQSLDLAVTAQLTTQQGKAYAEWRQSRDAAAAKPSMQWGPERVLQHFIKLEKALVEATLPVELTDTQFQQVRRAFQSGLTQRSALVEEVKKAMQGDGQEARERLETTFKAINETLEKQLKEALPPAAYASFTKWQAQNGPMMEGKSANPKSATSPRGESALVYLDATTGEPELFDFIHVTDRSAGYKAHFHKDHPLHGMTSINLIFEANDRFVLAEPLAYEVYRRAGNAAELTEFVRLSIDHHLLGYQLLIEQPNKAFLQRNKLKGDGSLYKLLWYGNGKVGQHEKKTHVQSGHEDLLSLIDQLEKTKDEEQWNVIQKHFNVPQVATYFAVNMCLSHWDGFFNNFFTYHDEGGKWEMYPWDQDKTWGFHDGLAEDAVFTDMPLTFGMEGDVPPSWPKNKPPPRGMTMDIPWWRPGGYFSKPLLAHPRFRQIFLTRTREILDNVYNEETFGPILNQLRDQLREEVEIRAKASGGDPAQAVKTFERNIESLRRHLVERRKFLLAQEEIRNAAR